MPKAGPRKFYFILSMLLACYLVVVFALADYMRNKPFVEKLGYIPSVNTMKVLAADHKQFLSASLILKVLVYFGGMVDRAENQFQIPADYPAMSRSIDAALKLDPYNMDGYYFAQAILAWDVGKADLANSILEYGMKYRDWDWQLPYFAGFNYAYFLKDYDKAAHYYQRAAELSGNPLFMNLAGRYMHESGRTGMAIVYLETMEKSTRQASFKKTLHTRKMAFMAVRSIELAIEAYDKKVGKLPKSVEELVKGGYLEQTPKDPYGGRFYLDSNGIVKSTSGFAFPVKGK